MRSNAGFTRQQNSLQGILAELRPIQKAHRKKASKMRLCRWWLNPELSSKGTLIPTILNIENKSVLNNLLRNWMCLWTTTDPPWYLFTNTSFLDHQNEGPSADPKGLRPFCYSRLLFFPSTYNGKQYRISFPLKYEDIFIESHSLKTWRTRLQYTYRGIRLSFK